MEQDGFTKSVVPSCSILLPFVLFRKPFHNEYMCKNGHGTAAKAIENLAVYIGIVGIASLLLSEVNQRNSGNRFCWN